MSEDLKLWDNYFKKERTNYDYKGAVNTEHYKLFKNICRMNQAKLKKYLEQRLFEYYNEVYSNDGFLYVKGTNSNVLLTAHMDTVHKKTCKDIYEYHDKKNKRHILSSPEGIGGDDRCGIYAILKVLDNTDFRPTIIFCEDEEVGGVGSKKFCHTTLSDEVADGVNFMIEIDRANADDAVFYEETNDDFQRYVTTVTGTKEAYGSFSDICHLSEETMVSSFNISCGYYNAHTTSEYVVMEELEECIRRVIKLLKANAEDNKAFAYVPYDYKTVYNNHYGYGYGLDDDDYEVEFLYYDKDGKECIEVVAGEGFAECVGIFLIEHSDIAWNNVIDYTEYDSKNNWYINTKWSKF